MGRLFADTSQAIEDELIARLRAVPSWRKLQMVDELNAATRQLMMAGLRQRHPDASPIELHQRMAYLLYGAEVAFRGGALIEEKMTALPTPINVMVSVTQTLEHLGIPYAVGGSMAAAVHGISRTTLDVDLVVALQMGDVTPLVQSLGDNFYADEGMIREAVERRGSFNLIHNQTLYKVDIFVTQSRPFDRQQIARRVRRVVDEETQRQVYLLSAEDIILAKLDWYRLGNSVSDRQWQDILGVLAVQKGQLDEAYLRQAAAELGVADLLERALRERDGR